MSKPLILNSLEVQGFRAFKHLQIERLGRVNLITGKNNVGKSYLLEALSVYTHRGSPSEILQLMQERDEIRFLGFYPRRSEESDLDEQILNIRHLFYGRSEVQESVQPIKIGPIGDLADSLFIKIGWFSRTGTEGVNEQQPQLFESGTYAAESQLLALVIQLGSQEQEYYPLARYLERRPPLTRDRRKMISSIFVRADGLEEKDVASLWDSIALTDLEEEVLVALRIIAPQVDRVTLVGEQGERRGRVPIVKTSRFDVPVPLRSMGEGMNRLLGIALALASARDGILLVDEIESGLHYAVQLDLWRLIFNMAHRLNVQVFATTHSWDCIAAFQQAASGDEEEEGLLISLRRKQNAPEQVVAVLFDEEELATVTRENIEVR